MIKIEKTEVYGWQAAIRGMRNPLNSWANSDSGLKVMNEDDVEFGEEPIREFIVGENDKDLMLRLRNSGTDHRKFMRMLTVTCDITAPLYWFKQFDCYRMGVEKNSCSTMHKIQAKQFEPDDFSFEHLTTCDAPYEDNVPHGELTGEITYWCGCDFLFDTIMALNFYRKKYLETKDKKYWWQMIQLLPSSYNQKRTVQMSYEAIANMYHARKHHKLDEWHDFCNWAESLPHSWLITGDENNA